MGEWVGGGAGCVSRVEATLYRPEIINFHLDARKQL